MSCGLEGLVDMQGFYRRKEKKEVGRRKDEKHDKVKG